MTSKPMRLRAQLLTQAQLALAALFVVLPVLWMLRLAFDGGMGGRPDDASLLPSAWTLDNLRRAWAEPRADMSFAALLANSLQTAGATALIALAAGAGAAYALARYRFPGRRIGLLAALALAALPPAGLAAPYFFYLSSLGLRQSLLGLTLVYTAIALPLAVWTLRTAVEAVPRDLEEAAALEGAGPGTVFARVTLPLIAPTLAVAGFLAFLVAWSEYALAWAIISDPKLVTLAMALSNMRDSTQVSWGLLSATSLLVALPVLALFYALGARAIDGLSLGAARSR